MPPQGRYGRRRQPRYCRAQANDRRGRSRWREDREGGDAELVLRNAAVAGFVAVSHSPLIWPARRLAGRDRALLFRQLAILLRAGLSPAGAREAVAAVAADHPDGRMAAALLAAMRGGASLADAMAASGDSAFGGHAVAMVRAGERMGGLEVVASRLAAVGERAVDLRRGAAAAILMPLLLLATSVSAAAMLVTARVSLVSGHVALAGWGWPVLGCLGALALRARRAADPGFRLACDRALLRLPLLGRPAAAAEASSLLRGLSRLLLVGVPPLPALAILAIRPRNAAAAAALDRAMAGLRRGGPVAAVLAAVLAADGWVPAATLRRLAAAEDPGCPGEAAGAAASDLDRPAARLAARLLAVPEGGKAAGAAALAGLLTAAFLHAV